MDQKLDWIDRLSALLTTKAMAATSGAAAAGGMAAEQVPRLAEASLFHAFGYAVTLPALSMIVAILAGLLTVFKPLIVAGLRRSFR